MWDKDLARIFHEDHQTRDEEAGAGARPREPEIEEDVPINLGDIELIPRINVDSIVEENDEVAS